MFKRKKPQSRVRQQPQTQRPNTPVFSYYSKRGVESTPRISASSQTQKTSRGVEVHSIIRHIPTYIATIGVVISCLYALSLDVKPKVVIGTVDGSNTLVRSQRVYQDAIGRILSKSILNKTKLTINTASVATEIQKTFPEIQHATVTLPILGRRPLVGLDPAQPTLIVAGTTDTFIVGEDGTALLRTKDLAAGSQLDLPRVEDQSGLPLEQGKQILPKENVTFITTIIQQLKLKRVTVSGLTLPVIANELHIKIDGKPYFVKFNLQGDARPQAGTFLALKDKLESEGVGVNEYIDVRLEERAYYK